MQNASRHVSTYCILALRIEPRHFVHAVKKKDEKE